jgi:hypothetical protein
MARLVLHIGLERRAPFIGLADIVRRRGNDQLHARVGEPRHEVEIVGAGDLGARRDFRARRLKRPSLRFEKFSLLLARGPVQLHDDPSARQTLILQFVLSHGHRRSTAFLMFTLCSRRLNVSRHCQPIGFCQQLLHLCEISY